MFPTWYRQLSPAAKRVYTSGGRFESLPAAEVLGTPMFEPFEWFHREITGKDQLKWWNPAVSGDARDINRLKANTPAILCTAAPTDSEALTAALCLAVKWTLFGLDVQVIDLGDDRSVKPVLSGISESDVLIFHNVTDDSTANRVEATRDVLRYGQGKFMRVIVSAGEPEAVGRRLRYKEFAAVFNLYTASTESGETVRRVGKVQHR